VASAIQLATVVLAVVAALVAIRVADDEASYLVAVVATQLVSPLLWEHYAVLLLLPVAWLLESRPVVGGAAAAGDGAAGARDRAGRGLPDRVRDLPRRADPRRSPSRDDELVGGPGRGGDVMRREMTWTRIAADSLVLIGIIAAIVYWVYLTKTGGAPVDVRAYWAADPANLYPHPGGRREERLQLLAALRHARRTRPAALVRGFVAIWRAILCRARLPRRPVHDLRPVHGARSPPRSTPATSRSCWRSRS
jgi:hypothetical protein